MLRVALVGGGGGIGAALLAQLCQRTDVASVHSTYFTSDPAQLHNAEANAVVDAKLTWTQVDITEEASVRRWLSQVGSIDWLINCAGYLHDHEHKPEKAINQFNTAYFNRCMAINCLSNLLLSQYAGDLLKQSDNGIFAALSAKVGSIEDNRLGGWYSYRASKAATNMVLKNLAIEWGRSSSRIRVLALHPGTTDTNLSKPFQSRVAPHKLFTSDSVASMLLAQLDQAHEHPSGRFVAYDGEEIPW